jgi:hypothetical protein
MANVDEIVRLAAMALVRRSIDQLPRCSSRAVEEALWPAAVKQHAAGLLYALNNGEARPVMDAVRVEAQKIVDWMDGQLGHYWLETEELSDDRF